MKILNAIHAQSIGGVDQMFRNYTKVLTNNKHEISLLISDNGNDDYNNLHVKKIFKLKNRSQISDFLNLCWILVTYRPDIIICHSKRLMQWMSYLKFLVKTKSVAVNHGITFKKSLGCDYVISINQEISQMVIAQGFDAQKSFILPNVIAIDEKYHEKKLKTLPVIGIYGRIEPRKGFDILLAAAEILQKSGHDFHLKIGGFEVPGAYNLQTLKNLAKERNIYEKCQFVGIVKDKKSFFSNVDIFCVPSREEPFGLVILEAFLYSTLAISSNSVGGKLLIKDNIDGLLFENENPQDLAEKIIWLQKNQEKYCDFTKKAYSKLCEEYSFDALASNFEKILQAIVKKSV